MAPAATLGQGHILPKDARILAIPTDLGKMLCLAGDKIRDRRLSAGFDPCDATGRLRVPSSEL